MRTNLLLAPCVAALLATAACGSDNPDGATEASSTTTAGSTAVAGSGNAITVTAVDYRFEGLPAEVAAGSRITLHNGSGKEVHEFIAYRLPDDEERTVQELIALPEDEFGALLAGPPPVGLMALPGEDGEIVAGVDTLAEPGRYLVFCAIPLGATASDVQAAMSAAQETDGPPPEIPGGAPHFSAGMVAEVRVK